MANLDIICSDLSMLQVFDLAALFGLAANLKGILADSKVALFRICNGHRCARLVDEERFPNITGIGPSR